MKCLQNIIWMICVFISQIMLSTNSIQNMSLIKQWVILNMDTKSHSPNFSNHYKQQIAILTDVGDKSNNASIKPSFLFNLTFNHNTAKHSLKINQKVFAFKFLVLISWWMKKVKFIFWKWIKVQVFPLRHHLIF